MSASQLLYGSPAKAAVPPYCGVATLNGAGTVTFNTPFPVSANTLCFLTPQGAAPAGALFYTRVLGPAGVGSITVTSGAGAGDAGRNVAVQVINAGAEGF